ncbi:peptidylprolyl isomerase [Litchfieldia salsa]|uniref:Peptidyl-prolyl cis-trans isomerase n=1 Tax=Litchfieldia salsa TaxID=930152 RepID=A0A1H0TAK7_9BACI|nr:peptidylprolyl isomerase [Litchfieldia salsa]SDP50638.1 peptidyl-prolyl cis-trans isomerase B (cyclophilin B) [Litchfieldia salsa]
MTKIRTYSILFSTILLLVMTISGCGTSSDQNTGENGSSQPEPFKVDKNPIVTIMMENNKEIKLELYPEVAPNTVMNFISLIEQGYYDGLTFHRVIPQFMVQGGDPQGTGAGGPGYSIAGEFTSNDFVNDLSHSRGILSMARTQDPNSAGSQFFIMVEDKPDLDGEYAAFGKVIEGMETVDEIVQVATDDSDKPLEAQIMTKVTVETFDFDYDDPVKQ